MCSRFYTNNEDDKKANILYSNNTYFQDFSYILYSNK